MFFTAWQVIPAIFRLAPLIPRGRLPMPRLSYLAGRFFSMMFFFSLLMFFSLFHILAANNSGVNPALAR